MSKSISIDEIGCIALRTSVRCAWLVVSRSPVSVMLYLRKLCGIHPTCMRVCQTTSRDTLKGGGVVLHLDETVQSPTEHLKVFRQMRSGR